jgi:hypothetical protein
VVLRKKKLKPRKIFDAVFVILNIKETFWVEKLFMKEKFVALV